MGKRRRKRQMVADTWEPPARRKPTHPQVPAHLRDPLFGSPHVAGTARLAYRDYDPRHTMTETSPARAHIPYQLHRHVPDGTLFSLRDVACESDDTLGAPAWTGAFDGYIGWVVPRSIAEPRRQWTHWWTIPGIADWLQCRYPVEHIAAILTVCWNPHADYHDVAARCNKSDIWLKRMERRMGDYVRTHFLSQAA